MAIPKAIHYCWFGRQPKPALICKCIKSWRKYCPDYEIIEWNEDNFDITACPLYVRQAYAAKKWAFVTDYIRLRVVYDHGGIYLDTDVEVIKSLDFLLNSRGFFAFENGVYIATGLGFGAEKGSEIILEMMNDYLNIPFLRDDGSFDTSPCPGKNTAVLLRHGLIQNNTLQCLDGYMIYPKDYFCPVSYSTGKLVKTKNTVAIHWFTSSWYDSSKNLTKCYEAKRIKRINRRHYIKTFPNRILRMVVGDKRYSKLKDYFREQLK